MVGGKKFPYTKKGIAAAKKAMKKKIMMKRKKTEIAGMANRRLRRAQQKTEAGVGRRQKRMS